MPRTFLERFGCSTAAVLADVVNKYAERKGLEILSISINVDKEARYRYEAIVLFEKPLVFEVKNPGIISGPALSSSQ